MVKDQKSLYDHLTDTASKNTERNLFGDCNGWYNALQVLSLSEHMASAFIRNGIRDGDHVLLKVKPTVPTTVVLFALRAAGATVVLAPPEKSGAGISGFVPGYPLRAMIDQTSASGFSVTMDNGSTGLFDLFRLQPSRLTPLRQSPNEPAFVPFSALYGTGSWNYLSEGEVLSLLPGHDRESFSNSGSTTLTVPAYEPEGLATLCGSVVYGYSVFLQA